MEKLVYKTPSVQITKWSSQDIITTSGKGLAYIDNVVSAVGDDNVTKTISYGEIDKE